MASTPALERPLRPFRAEQHLQGIELCCAAAWQAGLLSLHFRLSGPLVPLVLPDRTDTPPQRRDALWQSTCFEAFIGRPGQPGYWELNLAPDGDWNLYALSGYRENLQPEQRIEAVPFTLQRQTLDPQEPGVEGLERLDLQLSLDLSSLIPPEAAVELSATAVLESAGQGCSYWAWEHTGPEPDFHRRDSFLTPYC
jgi:hypothetical protein